MIASTEFQDNANKLETEFYRLSGLLNKFSVPFFSPRYAGHMCFETSMPAILGWILTILYNPNNVRIRSQGILCNVLIIILLTSRLHLKQALSRHFWR